MEKVIRKVLVTCMFCFLGNIHAQEPGEPPLEIYRTPIEEITITGTAFPYHSNFDIKSSKGPIGTVIKEKYLVWTRYGFYGNKGDKELLADTYINFLSLGQIFSWSSVMNAYSPSGEYVGGIEGWWFTFTPAKFTFTDKNGNTIATAFLEYNKITFSLLDIKDNHLIGSYNRIVVDGVSDHWQLNLYEKTSIPQALLILFGAFAADHQQEFISDNFLEPLEPANTSREPSPQE